MKRVTSSASYAAVTVAMLLLTGPARAGSSDLLVVTRTGEPGLFVPAVYQETLDEGAENAFASIAPPVIFSDPLRLFDFTPNNPNFDPNNPNRDPNAPKDEYGNTRVRTVILREQDGTISDAVQLFVDPASPEGLSVQYTQLTFEAFSDPGLPAGLPTTGGLYETGSLQDLTILLFPGYYKPGQEAIPPFQVQFQSDLDAVPEPTGLVTLATGLMGAVMLRSVMHRRMSGRGDVLRGPVCARSRRGGEEAAICAG